MHVARRTPQPHDPNPDEAVHPAVARLLQEAGEPGGGVRHVPGLLQLLLADPLSRLRREAGQARPPAAVMAGVTDRVWKFDELF